MILPNPDTIQPDAALALLTVLSDPKAAMDLLAKLKTAKEAYDVSRNDYLKTVTETEEALKAGKAEIEDFNKTKASVAKALDQAQAELEAKRVELDKQIAEAVTQTQNASKIYKAALEKEDRLAKNERDFTTRSIALQDAEALLEKRIEAVRVSETAVAARIAKLKEATNG